MISRYRAFREGQNIDKGALTASLPFSFVYYTVEGGDHLRVIVRSQRDQLPDQVGGLSPDDQMKIFDALFYMKVTALSPASSLNPIIPVSGLLARFNTFFSSEDGYNEQKHKALLFLYPMLHTEAGRRHKQKRVTECVRLRENPTSQSLRPRP